MLAPPSSVSAGLFSLPSLCARKTIRTQNHETEEFFGKQIAFSVLEPSQLIPAVARDDRAEWQLIEPTTAFPDWDPDTQIILGVTNGIHGYLVIKNLRLEPWMAFFGYSVTEHPYISEGLIIRLVDVPTESINGIVRAMEAREPGIAGLSCINKTGAALTYGGIQVPGGNPMLAADQVAKWIVDGFILADGTRVSSELYVEKGVSLNQIYRKTERRQSHLKRFVEQNIRELREKDMAKLMNTLKYLPREMIDHVSDPELKAWLERNWPEAN